MKSFEEFSKLFKKANVKKEKIEKLYKRYADDRFNMWLSQYSADEINKVGLDIFRKIFDTMESDDK
jgi:hypothetical protein